MPTVFGWVQASLSRVGAGGSSVPSEPTQFFVVCFRYAQASNSESVHILTCRYFVLKQGKIFWFKSDVITPVSTWRQSAAARQSFADCPKLVADVCAFMCAGLNSTRSDRGTLCLQMQMLIQVSLPVTSHACQLLPAACFHAMHAHSTAAQL